jgi:hypothetical protein
LHLVVFAIEHFRGGFSEVLISDITPAKGIPVSNLAVQIGLFFLP